MTIVNSETGKEPTEREMEMLKMRAIEIFASPYASPEQLEWAIEVYPEGFIEAIILEPTIYHYH